MVVPAVVRLGVPVAVSRPNPGQLGLDEFTYRVTKNGISRTVLVEVNTTLDPATFMARLENRFLNQQEFDEFFGRLENAGITPDDHWFEGERSAFETQQEYFVFRSGNHKLVLVGEHRDPLDSIHAPSPGFDRYTFFRSVTHAYERAGIVGLYEAADDLATAQFIAGAGEAVLHFVPFGTAADYIWGDYGERPDTDVLGVYLQTVGDAFFLAGLGVKAISTAANASATTIRYVSVATAAGELGVNALASMKAIYDMRKNGISYGSVGDVGFNLLAMYMGFKDLRTLRIQRAADIGTPSANNTPTFEGEEVLEQAVRQADEALVIANQQACFAADTPVLTPDGHKSIQDLRPGDLVLARSELEPLGDVRPQRIDKVFRLTSPTIKLHVGGHVVETTREHPFFVAEKGWTPAAELEEGDAITGHNEAVARVTKIENGDVDVPVFNLRVVEDHTYFVGESDWAFSLWVHNSYSVFTDRDGVVRVLDEHGNLVSNPITGPVHFTDVASAQRHVDSLPRQTAPDPNWTSTQAKGADVPLPGQPGYDGYVAEYTQRNARTLRDNLNRAGYQISELEAHHIVASTHTWQDAINARNLLDEYQIDINSTFNGAPVTNAQHHGRGLHSHAGMTAVNERLQEAAALGNDWAGSRSRIIEELATIRAEIQASQFTF